MVRESINSLAQALKHRAVSPACMESVCKTLWAESKPDIIPLADRCPLTYLLVWGVPGAAGMQCSSDEALGKAPWQDSVLT